MSKELKNIAPRHSGSTIVVQKVGANVEFCEHHWALHFEISEDGGETWQHTLEYVSIDEAGEMHLNRSAVSNLKSFYRHLGREYIDAIHDLLEIALTGFRKRETPAAKEERRQMLLAMAAKAKATFEARGGANG